MVNPAMRAVRGLMRFGLGPRPGDLVPAGADPEGLLLSELASADPPPPTALSGSAELLRGAAEAAAMKKAGGNVRPGKEIEAAFEAEAGDRIERCLRTSAGLRE